VKFFRLLPLGERYRNSAQYSADTTYESFFRYVKRRKELEEKYGEEALKDASAARRTSVLDDEDDLQTAEFVQGQVLPGQAARGLSVNASSAGFEPLTELQQDQAALHELRLKYEREMLHMIYYHSPGLSAESSQSTDRLFWIGWATEVPEATPPEEYKFDFISASHPLCQELLR